MNNTDKDIQYISLINVVSLGYMQRNWEMHWDAADNVVSLFIVQPDEYKNTAQIRRIVDLEPGHPLFPVITDEISMSEAAVKLVKHYSTNEPYAEIKGGVWTPYIERISKKNAINHEVF